MYIDITYFVSFINDLNPGAVQSPSVSNASFPQADIFDCQLVNSSIKLLYYSKMESEKI